jgi:hypothetical protein
MKNHNNIDDAEYEDNNSAEEVQDHSIIADTILIEHVILIISQPKQQDHNGLDEKSKHIDDVVNYHFEDIILYFFVLLIRYYFYFLFIDFIYKKFLVL